MKRHDSQGKKWGPPRPSTGMRRGAAGLGPRHTRLSTSALPRGAQHAEGNSMDGAGCSARQRGSPTCPRLWTRPSSLLGVSPSSGPRCAGAAHTESWGPVNACWAAQGVPEPTPPSLGPGGKQP